MPLSLQNAPILDQLLQLKPVRAVLWLDPTGAIKARRGDARAIKLGPDDPTSFSTSAALKGKEAVYIRRFRDTDYLAVLFSEDADFDGLKKEIDLLVDGKANRPSQLPGA